MWTIATWTFWALPLIGTHGRTAGAAKTRKVAMRKDPLALVGVLVALVNLVSWPSIAHAEEVSAVAQIQAIGSTVEITVTSSKLFPMRALYPILAIGDARFSRSRYPSDGRLDTLIFIVPAEDFALLQDGDPVTVYYGEPAPTAAGSPAGHVWVFGGLDKSGLQQ